MSGRQPPRLLSIAGSDPGGGAGIQADLKTFAAHGGYGMTVLTAITVQSTAGVALVEPLSPDLVERQYRSVVDDIGVDAVKIGMLATAGIVSRVARCLETLGPDVPIVLDPVLAASDGTPLLGPGGLERLVEELLPRATVITPNRGEAEAILGTAAAGEVDLETAARELHARGPAVLVTGGDAPGDEVVDLLVAGGEVTVFRLPRLHTRSTHGTGCTLSSAIAALLAGGAGLHQAVEGAIGYVRGAMDPGLALGRGRAPLDHGFARGARIGRVGATRDRR